MIHFDPTDFEGMLNLMDDYGDSKTKFLGTKEEGEDVHTSILPDKIVTETFQHNGWIRKNIYYRDGSREELYNK